MTATELLLEPTARSRRELAANGRGSLFALTFGEEVVSHGSVPLVVPVPCPAHYSESDVELWRTGRRVTPDAVDGVSSVRDGEILAICLRQEAGMGRELAHTTRAIYRSLLSRTRQAGYPHLLRAWNFVPDINREEDGQERYRHFCYGRSVAFEEAMGPAHHHLLPAGTAVGAVGSELVVVLLATRHENRHLSNPRQVDAFRYPSAYGPRSPSFSRATLASPKLGELIFLAGTASIVGHESRHDEDVEEQVRETLENLGAILRTSGNGADPLRRLSLMRVYVRFPEHLEAVRAAIHARLPVPPPTIYLGADICRPELLVEIEGVARPSGN